MITQLIVEQQTVFQLSKFKFNLYYENMFPRTFNSLPSQGCTTYSYTGFTNNRSNTTYGEVVVSDVR